MDAAKPVTARYERARVRERPPTFVPVPRATLSSEWLLELGRLLDLDAVHRDYVECAVNWICGVINDQRGRWARVGTVTRVARVGSFYKDTSICINFDVDLVVQLRDLDVISDEGSREAAQIGREVLAPYLPNEPSNWVEQHTPDKRRVRVTLDKLETRRTSLLIAVAVQPHTSQAVPPLVISMDVLFTRDCSHEGDMVAARCARQILYKRWILQYFTENNMDPGLNRRLQPLVSEAAQLRVRGQDPTVRALIRIVKAWNLLLLSTRSEARARSTVLETIVLIIVDQWPDIVAQYGLPDAHKNPTIGALFLEVLRQLAQVESMQLGDRLSGIDQAPRLDRNGVRKSMRKDKAVLLNRVDLLNNLLSTDSTQVFSEKYREELAESVSFVLQQISALRVQSPFGMVLPQNRLFTTSRLGFHLCLHIPNDPAARTFPASSTTGEAFKATNFHRQLAMYLLLRARDAFTVTTGMGTVDDPRALITRSETTWSRAWSTAAELSLPTRTRVRPDPNAHVDWRAVSHGSWCQDLCRHQVGVDQAAVADDAYAQPLRTIATDVAALLFATVQVRVAHKVMKREIPSVDNSDRIVVAVPVALPPENGGDELRTAMLHMHVWAMRYIPNEPILREGMVAADEGEGEDKEDVGENGWGYLEELNGLF
ncbi:hypothetical protein GGF32_006106 [Allomyces javanicus]|nr:hypothetical protein GGF32_006106 [Allomyces javanicus]